MMKNAPITVLYRTLLNLSNDIDVLVSAKVLSNRDVQVTVFDTIHSYTLNLGQDYSKHNI